MGISFRRKKRDKRKLKQKKQNVNSLDLTQGASHATTTTASAVASVTTLRASNMSPSTSTHTPTQTQTQTSSPPQSPLRPAASSTTVTPKSTPVAGRTKNKPDRGFGSYTLSSTISNSSLSSYSSSVVVQQNDTNISTSSTSRLESNHNNGVGMQDEDDNRNNALNEETLFSKSSLDDNNQDDEKKQQQHPHPQLVQVVNLKRSDVDDMSQRDENQKQQNGEDNDQVTRSDVGQSMNAWVSDMNTLVSSSVFQNATISTMALASTIFQSMLRITFYPLVKPIQISSSMLYSTIALMKYSTFALTKSLFVHSPNNSNSNLNLNSNLDSNSNLSSNTLHSKNVVDHSDDTVETRESSNSLVHNLIDCSLSFFFGANAIRGGRVDETNRSDEKPMNDNHDYEKESMRYFDSENMERKEEDDEYIPLVYEGEDKDENVVNLNQQHSTISSSSSISSSSHLGYSPTTNATSKGDIISKTADDNNNEEHKNETIEEKEKPKHLPSKQNRQLISSPSFYIRTGDLNVYHHDPTAARKHDSNKEGTNSSSFHMDTSIEMRKMPASTKSTLPNNKLLFLELQLSHAICTSMAATSARMNIIQTMEEMVQMGIKLTVTNPQAKGKGPNHKLVSWKEEGSTSKLLKRVRASLQDNEKWYSNPKTIKMLEKETLTWSGYVQKDRSSTESQSFAPKIPIFKARGVISGMNPQQLTELFLDSERVKSYNKWSNGRKDLAVFQDDLDMVGGKYGDGCLKVVQSETSIPLSSNKLKMTNFLHARSIKLDYHELFGGEKNDTYNGTNGGKHNAYIIASRTAFNQEDVSEDMKSDDKDIKPGSQNEIIWGLNILLEIPGHPDKTDLTTFNQANSSAVPSFLVNKIGLTCAGDFFKNVRGMKSI
jgi:hypothetical protein